MSVPQYKGVDIPVFSTQPNWSTPPRLGVDYGDIVTEALDTSEERIGTRPRPLYKLTYQTLTLTGQEMGYIRRVMELAQSMPMLMPVWHDYVPLTEAASIGETVLSVDDVGNTLWAVLVDYAILWESFKSWEVVQLVAPPSGTTLTLSSGLVSNWPEGTRVMPVLIGDVDRATVTHLTDINADVPVKFMETFNQLTDQSRNE